MRDHNPLVDVAAERAVLASMMIDPRTIVTARAAVGAEDFAAPAHAVIWESLCAVAARGEPVDVFTVAAELTRRNRLNTIGGAQYLDEITDTIPTTANIEVHCALVADLAARRRTVEVARQIQGLAVTLRGEELAAKAAELLRSAQPRAPRRDRSAVDVAAELHARICRPPEAQALEAALPSGWGSLDALLSLGRGRLYVIAGRPAMGKSAVAGQLAHHAASIGRGRVIVFTLEMPEVEVAHRDVAGRAGVSSRAAESGALVQTQVDAYVAELNALANRSIWYDGTPRPSVDHIESVCQRHRLEDEIALVVIDYLQLMKLAKSERHDLAVGEVTARLKALAKSLGCPVVLLSQLNRDCESRPDKRPMLSDLRDSGSIEQDADGVVFVYRDEVYRKNSEDKGITELIIAKQRNGPTGTVRLKWNADLVRLADGVVEEDFYSVGGFQMGADGEGEV